MEKTNMNTVLKILSDCYTNNKLFDRKLISQEEWENLKEELDINDDVLSKQDIFDCIYEATGFYDFDEETICSFGNLSLALMVNSDFAEFIIENEVKFKEFVRYKLDDKGTVRGIDVLPIEQIKFSDILFHFNGHFENWDTDTSILAGSLLVSLCDYLNVKIETIDETPANWHIPEYEFEEFESKDDLKRFSRLFSKPMNKWYGDRWCDV